MTRVSFSSCFCSAGRQQRRAHGGRGLSRVRLPPPTQRHHQPQGHCLHRWVERPSSSSSHTVGQLIAVFSDTLMKIRFSCLLFAAIFMTTAASVKHDSVPDCRLHNFHPSALTSLANGGRLCQ